jgi:hypothetical protein
MTPWRGFAIPERITAKLVVTIVGAVCLLWVLTPIVMALLFPGLAERGQAGDLYGSINSLFSGLAFAGIIVAILLQREELALQRKELQFTREELSRSATAQERAADHIAVVERAYVKMSHVSRKEMPDGSMIEGLILSGGKASVVIQVTNHGNTPAEVTDAFVQSCPGPLPRFPAYQRPESRTDRQGFLVRQDHFNFTEDLEHAPAPRQDLFVFGYVTYKDRFGVTHYGGYARQYLRGAKGNNLGFVDNPNYNFDSESLPRIMPT